MIRVLVADDHTFYREGIRSLVAAYADEIEVVGEATSGEEAVDLVASLHPDVVLMDLRMPGGGGIEATRLISQQHPSTGVLVLTMLDDDSVLPALRAGARGYLLKDASIEVLVGAIRSVHRGDTILTGSAAERVQQRLSQTQPSATVFPQLTNREHELLAELMSGRGYDEIAVRLGLTAKTVRNYVSSILTKLHVRNRAELTAKAQEAGFESR